MKTIAPGCIAASVVFAVIVGISAVLAYLFMLVWNGVVPSVFNGPTLAYWQALCLWVLIGMIGGMFRSNGNTSNKR